MIVPTLALTAAVQAAPIRYPAASAYMRDEAAVMARCTGRRVLRLHSVSAEWAPTVDGVVHVVDFDPSSPDQMVDGMLAEYNRAMAPADRWQSHLHSDYAVLGNWLSPVGDLIAPFQCSALIVDPMTDLRTFLDDPSCEAYSRVGEIRPTEFNWTGPMGRVSLPDYLLGLSASLDYSVHARCVTESGKCFISLAPHFGRKKAGMWAFHQAARTTETVVLDCVAP